MLLAHQDQLVWEKYTGWKDYPKHPSWQYKEAFWKPNLRRAQKPLLYLPPNYSYYR